MNSQQMKRVLSGALAGFLVFPMFLAEYSRPPIGQSSVRAYWRGVNTLLERGIRKARHERAKKGTDGESISTS